MNIKTMLNEETARLILNYIDSSFFLYLKADLTVNDYNKIVSNIARIISDNSSDAIDLHRKKQKEYARTRAQKIAEANNANPKL